MCLRRGAARHIWFVFQPDENKGYYEDVWVFWEGETGNQLLNSQRVSRSRVQEEGWGHKNFCLFFSSRTWELRLAKLSWNQFFTDFVECKSNDRTGAANREQHLCSQGDRQVPGNIRVVLASPPHFPDGGRDVSCQTCCCLALYAPTNNKNWYVNSQAKTLP